MSQPNPFTANVNRAKTKKWVEAKSYSYDGDDWGEVDDYDEYGGYDEPEPEPAPKPTGLRQRGQSASQMPQEAYESRQDFYQSPIDSRQPHGNPSGLSSQQQYGGRSFTNPHPQQTSAIVRKSSFERDDERRAFSAGGPQQPSNDRTSGEYNAPSSRDQYMSAHDSHPGQPPNYPVQPQPGHARPPLDIPGSSNMEAQARYGQQIQSAGGNYRAGSQFDQARQPISGSRSQSMTSNNSGLEFHNRRDFSPSAMPPPLQTRNSPSPHGPDSRSSSRHPPRQSSLGQDSAPVVPFPTQPLPMPTARAVEDDDFPARDRAGSGAAKPLPFVRPADIYRRMQEEKERERQSQDSSRPSMEAILSRPIERPALGNAQDSESSSRLKPALDPVTERRSEYGMEGLNTEEQETLGERQPTSSKTFNFPKRAPNTSSPAPQSSLGPVLPDVSRLSGFGESLFGSSDNTGAGYQGSMSNFGGSSSWQPSQQQTQPSTETTLQHQPSLGFTSAVHQAFDKAEDQVPPTPSSTQGSSVARSASGGTSTVSPIISRGPSTATENWNARLPGIDNVSTPMIPERPEGSSARPLSSDSIETPTQAARKPSPLQKIPSQEVEERPPSFIPGYRRTSDTPSPDNSPRRTPALETNRQLRQPQEVELAAATPTDPSFSEDSSSLASKASSEQEPSQGQPTAIESRDMRGQGVESQAARGSNIKSPESTGSPMSPAYNHLRGRTDSSSSSRVRNLADKFESVSRPGSAHSTTPRASILGANAQKIDDLAPTRPLIDHRESFRPHLPGGWESSASIAPAATFKTPQAPLTRQDMGQNKLLPGAAATSTNSGSGPSEGMTPATDQPTSSATQIKDASEGAFAAVAAAGSALVDAFGAAVGMEHRDSPTEPTPDASSNAQSFNKRSVDYRAATQGPGAVHPEATRPHIPLLSDDEASTTAPTPLPENTPQGVAEPSQAPDYVPSSSREYDTRSDAYPVDEPRQQPPTLPLLSTDTGSEQYESDRLRKEIVKELTPLSPSEPTTAETDYSNYQPTLSTNPSVIRPGHESGVLPKEYESYWNDANSDDEVDDFQTKPTQVEDATTAERSVVQPLQLNHGHGHGPELPASVAQEGPVQGRPQMLPHRFSWEQPLQNLPAEARPAQEQTPAPTSSFLKSAVYPANHLVQSQEGPSEAYASPTIRRVTDPAMDESPSVPEKEFPISQIGHIAGRQDGPLDSEKELPTHPSRLEAALSTAGNQPDGSLTSGHVDDPNNMSPCSPVSQSDRGLESEPFQPEPPALIGPSPPVQLVDLPPMPPPANAQPKFPAFREILALKNPSDRIRAYNETRNHFANLNTGLAHWLAATTNDLPEHADLLTSSRQPAINLQGHRSSQSRSKLGGLLPSGGQSGQQPYFQQYLNASPGQTSAPDGNAPGNGMGSGSPQGFSPSGGPSGKLSSQQVQAKGKDLLHTAGVFGGKANVAAKGLFSKGKSKFRAASGNEKATSQISPGPEHSRGMQQQFPIVQFQSPTNARADLRVNSSKAVAQTPSPEPQYSSQSPQHKPSRDTPSDTPSVESFTQSQLGDDERSEESEPIDQTHLPRTSNLYLKHGPADLESSPSVQNPVAIGDSAPVFLHETPSADSYVESPKEIHSPRSTTSSNNRTPTQASFANGNPSATLRSNRQDGGERTLPWQEGSGAHDGESPHSAQLSQPNSRFSSQTPYNLDNRDAMGSNKPQKQPSDDVKNTIRTVGDESDSGEPLVVPSKPKGLPKADHDLISRAPARMSALAASEVSRTATDAQKNSAKPSRSRPFSSSRDSLVVPGASQDYSMRGSSIDSMPVRVGADRPPSPISPYQPNPLEALEQRGRAGPIHYGLDHDFVPDRDHERARSRSRSYSRTSAFRRPSQDSRRSRQPSTNHHSASRASSDIPPQSYSGEISREKSPSLRQQAPEYQVEGVSSPIEWPPESKPRSRRGSRSSAFFRSLTLSSSSKLEEPPLPNAPDAQTTSSPVVSPGTGERTGKRASILRSLTGNSGSGSASGQSKVNVTPIPSVLQHEKPTPATPAIAPGVEDDEFPSRGNSKSAASRLSKRLQRSSTSGNTEQATGKKKRFSGIGSLFGRGNPKRQSSSVNARIPSQEQPPAQLQQTDPYTKDPPPPRNPQQLSHARPDEDYTSPPPGGYYAPKPPHAHNRLPPPDPRVQRNGQSPSWVQDAPAYVQDATLRQRVDQRMSPPRSSATFPQNAPQHSSASVPRASTTRSMGREPFSERQTHESKPSGSSWTRFSQHGRSKSRQEQQRPFSNTSQQETPHSSPPTSRSFQMAQQPHYNPSRSDSPPPPPPPPKDDWHHARSQASMSSNPTLRSSQHGPSPTRSSSRPMPTQNRQSLPPLHTNVPNNKRQSAIALGKTLTPEEKRKSRQLEIERSTISPHYREEREEEPPVVMSATSFPGQLWQPEYSHWDGD